MGVLRFKRLSLRYKIWFFLAVFLVFVPFIMHATFALLLDNFNETHTINKGNIKMIDLSDSGVYESNKALYSWRKRSLTPIMFFVYLAPPSCYTTNFWQGSGIEPSCDSWDLIGDAGIASIFALLFYFLISVIIEKVYYFAKRK